jgi:hypothetical protein
MINVFALANNTALLVLADVKRLAQSVGLAGY